MRIIAGEFRRRKLLSPPEGASTRPIPDRVKESLFGILRGNVEGAAVLDAFAGTGAIGLEALSRGAARCVFIERDKRVAETLRRNVQMLGCEDRAEVVTGDALGMAVLARCPRPVDLIFFDPPYPLVLDATPGGGWDRVRAQFSRLVDFLSDHGFAVLRTPWPFRHPDDPAVAAAEAEERARAERRGTERPGRGRRGRVGHLRAGVDLDDEGDEIIEELEDWDDVGPADGEEGPSGQGPVARHMVDLKLPNAIGPETHVYRHTALHFYMRRREDAAAADGPGPDSGPSPDA